MKRIKNCIGILLSVILVMNQVPVLASESVSEEKKRATYSQNFDDLTTLPDGWKSTSGTWTVEADRMQVSWAGSTENPNAFISYINENTERWSKYVVSANILVDKQEQNKLYSSVALCVNVTRTARTEVRVEIKDAYSYKVSVVTRTTDGAVEQKTTIYQPGGEVPGYSNGVVFYKLKIDMSDGSLKVYIDDRYTLEYDVSQDSNCCGGIGFFTYRTGADAGVCKVYLDDVRVTTDNVVYFEEGFEEESEINKLSYWGIQEGRLTAEWNVEDAIVYNSTYTYTDTKLAQILEENQDYVINAEIMYYRDAGSSTNVYPALAISNVYVGTSRVTPRIYVTGTDDYRLDLYNGSTPIMKETFSTQKGDNGFGEDCVSYHLAVKLEAGVWSWYIDGVKAWEYSLPEIEPTYKNAIDIYALRNGTGNVNVKVQMDNLSVSDAVEYQTVFSANDVVQTRKTEDEHFGQYPIGEIGDWKWEDYDIGVSEWAITEGVLVNCSDDVKQNAIAFSDSVCRSYGSVQTDVMITSYNYGKVSAGPVLAYKKFQDYYCLRIVNARNDVGLLELVRVDSGIECVLSSVEFEIERDKWYELKITMSGDLITGLVDGIDYISYTCNDDSEGDNYGFCGVCSVGGSALFDNYVIGDAYENDEAAQQYTDDFNDEVLNSSPDYWLEEHTTDYWKVEELDDELVYGKASATTSDTWLHVFETDVDMRTQLYVVDVDTDQSSCAVGLTVRKSGENAYVHAGYCFKENKWFVEDRKGVDYSTQTIWAEESTSFSLKTWHVVRVRIVDSSIQIWCDGVLVLESNEIGQVTTGRVGIFMQNASGFMDNITLSLLSGQGRVEKAVEADYILDDDGYIEGASLFWHSDDLAIINYDNRLWFSYDQGQTFEEVTDASVLSQYGFFRQGTRTQYIHLHSGNLLKIDNYTGGRAFLSKDNGVTYAQVGKLWDRNDLESNWSFYGGMNDMIKEVNIGDTDGDGKDEYRVFYCADVRAYGNPEGTGNINYHWEEIYYTDDEGYTWQKCEYDSRKVSGLNHVCESKIIACSDGTLRMYCSWNDSDCIRYYESYDNGVTWEGEYAIPQMKCTRSSFAVTEDPYHAGTYYMVFVYNELESWGSTVPRTRLVLTRSTNGKDWEFLMDIKRWDDVPNDEYSNINQIVDPSITVTEDFVFVLTGWSEERDTTTSHHAQRQNVTKLCKNALTAYDTWPGEANDDDIVSICVKQPPNKILYTSGETLDLTGGLLQVQYADGSVKKVSMADETVSVVEPDYTINYTCEMPEPDMTVIGKKILRVDYQNFSDEFYVEVFESATDYKRTVCYVNTWSQDVTNEIVDKYNKITSLNAEVEGYVLEGWYTTPNFETESKWDFEKDIVEDDITLYAKYVVDTGLVGYSLSLSGNICVNFYLDFTEGVRNDSAAYVKFLIAGKKETRVYVRDITADSNGYYQVSCKVSAKEMTDEICMQIVLSDGQETLKHTYSVLEYVNYILENETEYVEEVPLVKALLNYGAYSQLYFGYHVEYLANVGLSEEDRDVSAVSAETLAEYKNSVYQGNDKVVLKAANLVLKSETALKLYFEISDAYVDTVTFVYNGEQLSKSIYKDYYCIKIENISANKLADDFIVQIKGAGTEFEIVYNVMSYCYNVLAGEGSVYTSSFKNMAASLYLYHVAATEYLARN